MANWYGTSRSNYVRMADLEGFKKAVEPFDLNYDEKDGLVVFFCSDSSDGGWPGFGEDEETGEELEFSFEEHVVPYLADGEVLITMQAGAENLRYVSGYAAAYTKGESTLYVSLDDIYKKAAEEWGISRAAISTAAY